MFNLYYYAVNGNEKPKCVMASTLMTCGLLCEVK